MISVGLSQPVDPWLGLSTWRTHDTSPDGTEIRISLWPLWVESGLSAFGRVLRSGVRAGGKRPPGATAKSLVQAGHLSTAVVIADLR